MVGMYIVSITFFKRLLNRKYVVSCGSDSPKATLILTHNFFMIEVNAVENSNLREVYSRYAFPPQIIRPATRSTNDPCLAHVLQTGLTTHDNPNFTLPKSNYNLFLIFRIWTSLVVCTLIMINKSEFKSNIKLLPQVNKLL